MEFPNDPDLGIEASDQIPSELSTLTLDITVPDQKDREVVTSDDIETELECTKTFAQTSPKQCSTPKPCEDHNNDRKVVTRNNNIEQPPVIDKRNSITSLKMPTRSNITRSLQTPMKTHRYFLLLDKW